MKKFFVFVNSLVLVFSTVAFFTVKTHAAGTVIDVGPGGSIATAVAGASDGDTIRVAAGNYLEVNAITPAVSNLTIEGAGASTTTVENDTVDVFSIIGGNEVRNLIIKGFTIKERADGYGIECNMTTGHALGIISDNIINGEGLSGNNDNGIGLGNLCSFEVKDNQITDNIMGVIISNSNTETNIIHDNTIAGNGMGLFAVSAVAGTVTNSIYHNKINGNLAGLFLANTTASVYNNKIYENNAGEAPFNPFFSAESLVQIYANQIYQNRSLLGSGLFLLSSAAGSNVYNNYIAQNSTTIGPGGGIMSYEDSTPIFNNTIVNNTATLGTLPESLHPFEIKLEDADLQKKTDDLLQGVQDKITEISGEARASASSGLGGGVFVQEGGFAPPSFYNNIVFGNVGDNISDVGGTMSVTYSDVEGGYTGAGNISADPRLTGYVLGDDSPCIDTGTATGAPSDDIDGTARPQRGGIDIGAYELPAPAVAEATATAAATLPETGASGNNQSLFLALMVVSALGLIFTFAGSGFSKIRK